MKKGDADSGHDEIPIVVEAYGVKVDTKSRPQGLGEQPPSSWRDVPSLINQHLMRIAVAPTRLIAEALEGATRLIRGLSSLPTSVVNRIQRAHFEADAAEGQHQQTARRLIEQRKTSLEPKALLAEGMPDEDRTAQAIERIQAILQKYKDEGLDAYITFGSDGKPIIVLGAPPQSESQVREAIEQTKTLLNQPTEPDH
jgi:hypothetical protein